MRHAPVNRHLQRMIVDCASVRFSRNTFVQTPCMGARSWALSGVLVVMTSPVTALTTGRVKVAICGWLIPTKRYSRNPRVPTYAT